MKSPDERSARKAERQRRMDEIDLQRVVREMTAAEEKVDFRNLDRGERRDLDSLPFDERLVEARRRLAFAQDAIAAANRRLVEQSAMPKPAQKPSGLRAAPGGVLVCPKCGGQQFKARRSKAARFGIAAATVTTGGIAGAAGAAVTKQKKVQCVTCGTIYDRG